MVFLFGNKGKNEGKKEGLVGGPSAPFLVGTSRVHPGGASPPDPGLSEYMPPEAVAEQQPNYSSPGASNAFSAQAYEHKNAAPPSRTYSSPGGSRRGEQEVAGASKQENFYPQVAGRPQGAGSSGQTGHSGQSLYPQVMGFQHGGGGPYQNYRAQSFQSLRPAEQDPGFPREPSLSRTNSDPGPLEDERSFSIGPGNAPPPPEGAHVVAQQTLLVQPPIGSQMAGQEEKLVRVPGSMVHLIDGQSSVLLGSGEFSLVRLMQGGQGVVALVRVGNEVQWPLGWDEPVIKLDSHHYVFSLRVSPDDDDDDDNAINNDSNGRGGAVKYSPQSSQPWEAPPHAAGPSGQSQPAAAAPPPAADIISYGVTFPPTTPPQSIAQLDALLKQYCLFNEPDALTRAAKAGATAAQSPPPAAGAADLASAAQPEVLARYPSTAESAKEIAAASATAAAAEGGAGGGGGYLVATPDGAAAVQRAVDEEGRAKVRSAEFWTAVAPNVDNYRGALARGIARGSGHVIRGVLYAGDAASSHMDRLGSFAISRLSKAETDMAVSPQTMRNIRRVRKLTKRTDKVAGGILKGVVTATGFVSGKLLGSTLGRKAANCIPGEVAIVSLDAFARFFDAVEMAGKNMLNTSSVVTSGVVTHKYGSQAGDATKEALASTGHAIHTAWTVSKMRKAFDPRTVLNPMGKRAILKGAVKGITPTAMPASTV
eukprot:jgi/Mesen1/4241/ME000022S03530